MTDGIFGEIAQIPQGLNLTRTYEHPGWRPSRWVCGSSWGKNSVKAEDLRLWPAVG